VAPKKRSTTILVPVRIIGGCIPARVRVSDLSVKDFASLILNAYSDVVVRFSFGDWQNSEGYDHIKTLVNADSVIRFALNPNHYPNVRERDQAKRYLIKGLSAFGFSMTFDGLVGEDKATFYALRFERLKDLPDV